MRFLTLRGTTGGELLLTTDVVRMISAHSVSSPFSGFWKRNASNVSKITAGVAVPRLCGSPSARGGLTAARRRVRDVTRLCLRFTFMCVCVPVGRPDLTAGTVIVALAGSPYSHGSILTLYRAIRSMYSLPVYIGYGNYSVLRRS